MLNSRLIGDAHFNEPFTIGQLDPDKGYIHIFDDTTLTILLETLEPAGLASIKKERPDGSLLCRHFALRFKMVTSEFGEI